MKKQITAETINIMNVITENNIVLHVLLGKIGIKIEFNIKRTMLIIILIISILLTFVQIFENFWNSLDFSDELAELT